MAVTFEILSQQLEFDSNLREIVSNEKDYKILIADLQSKLVSANTEEKIELLGKVGTLLRIIGNLEEAEIYLKEALELSKTEGSQNKIFINTLRLAHVYQWKEDFDKAQKLFDSIANFIDEPNFPNYLKAFYFQHLGKLRFDQKQFGLALKLFESSLKIRLEIGAPSDLIESSKNGVEEAKKRL